MAVDRLVSKILFLISLTLVGQDAASKTATPYALTLLAVIFIVYAGFLWLTAAGNEKQVEKAKQVISAAVIGMIVILLAWAIVAFVLNASKNVTEG